MHTPTPSPAKPSAASATPHSDAVISKLKDFLEADELEEIAKLLQPLKELEKTNNEQKQTNAQLIAQVEQLEKSRFWEAAQEVHDAIKPNSGYEFDLTIENEKLINIAKISFRKTGQQDRHVTPISVISHIFREILYEGMTLEDARIVILHQLETFKISKNEKDEKFIQAIFDYYRHPGVIKNQDHLKNLLKIVAHFYNERSFLVMNEDCIKILSSTYQRYLIPPEAFGGGQYLHTSEGNFIAALNKTLTGYSLMLQIAADPSEEEQLSKAFSVKSISAPDRRTIKRLAAGLQSDAPKLKQEDLNKVIYAIYASFDFLPLPAGAANRANVTINPKNHRYQGEPMERLAELMANHLQFIFAAFPKLEECYQQDILNGFIKYVVEGVTAEDLKNIGITPEFAQLNKITDLKNFTNAGNVKGFNSQYPEANFKDVLTQNVVAILQARQSYDQYEAVDLSLQSVHAPSPTATPLAHQTPFSLPRLMRTPFPETPGSADKTYVPHSPLSKPYLDVHPSPQSMPTQPLLKRKSSEESSEETPEPLLPGQINTFTICGS